MSSHSELAYWRTEQEISKETVGAPHIEGLAWFPIKSGRAEFVDSLYVTRKGFKEKKDSLLSDRQLMLIDDKNEMISQRQMQALALLEVKTKGNRITLIFHGNQADSVIQDRLGINEELEFTFDACFKADDRHPEIETKVHTTTGIKAILQNNKANEWLSHIFNDFVQLAIQKPEEPRVRTEKPPGVDNLDTILAFADSYPFTALSYLTLDTLNQEIAEQYPDWPRFEPISFRMNLLLSGEINEHALVGKYLKIGDVYFYVMRPKARCTIPAEDQKTAKRRGKLSFGSDYQVVLRNLHEKLGVPEAWRNKIHTKSDGTQILDPQAMLGVDLIPLNEGTISVDMPVEILDEVPEELL